MPELLEEYRLIEIAAQPSSLPLTKISWLVPSLFTAVITDPSRRDMERWRRSSLPSPRLHFHHRTFLSPEAQRSNQTDLSKSGGPAASLLAAAGDWLGFTSWWVFLGAYVWNYLETHLLLVSDRSSWASFHGIISKYFLTYWCCFYFSIGMFVFVFYFTSPSQRRGRGGRELDST